MIKPYLAAQSSARELLVHARANEPRITEDLQKIAAELLVEIVGLENKFKTQESLIRKLMERAEFNLQSINEAAENINDVLRYTLISSFETYTLNFHRTIGVLKTINYHVPENRIWNAWQTIGKRFDKGYRGINITLISSQKQKFELQFHTMESFQLKTDTHFLYEELRDRRSSKERQSEIIESLRVMAKDIKRPAGV